MNIMSSKTYVRITIERQKLILGQIGNMHLKIHALRHAIVDAEKLELEEHVRGLEIEVEFMEQYFPTIPDDFPF